MILNEKALPLDSLDKTRKKKLVTAIKSKVRHEEELPEGGTYRSSNPGRLQSSALTWKPKGLGK